MNCEGREGQHKRIDLAVTLVGKEFTGKLSQTSTVPGSNTPISLEGAVSGRRIEDTATFQVRFSGLTPVVTVALRLETLSIYSVHVSTLGMSLMDVTFNRVADR